MFLAMKDRLMIETSVYIKDMRLHAFHGVLPQERTVGNDYVINVTVDYPWRHAAESDDVCDTLNYVVLANIIKQEMAAPSNLLEHVAMRIANSVKAKFALTSAISIDIRKIAPPISHVTEGCGVTLKMRY